MTTSDASRIMAGIALLTTQVNEIAVKLGKIEERTSVLADHEVRIRAAEEAARIAGEVAVRANATAEANRVKAEAVSGEQAIRIRTLEDNDRVSGRFSWGDVTKVIMAAAALSAIVGVVYAILGG